MKVYLGKGLPAIYQTHCCGIYELDGIDLPPINSLYSIIDFCDSKDKFNMFIFTDAIRYGSGERLRKFISRYKLGKVISSPIVYNPNSSNRIKMWIFIPNWNIMSKFSKKLEVIDEF